MSEMTLIALTGRETGGWGGGWGRIDLQSDFASGVCDIYALVIVDYC